MADGVVARLKILLGIDSAEVTTGARKTEREVSKMSKGISGAAKLATTALGALGAVLTVDTIVRVTKQALDYTTAIKAQAREAGVTTQALQEYRYAALRAGTSNEDLADGFKELTLKVGQAATEGKDAAKVFTDAGIRIRDASGNVRNAADILPELSDAYRKLGSEAEKAAFAAKIFGEDVGPKMAALLEQGSAGMKSYRDAAQELGMVISDVNIKKAEEAEKKMAALNRVLSVKVATFIAENAGAIADLADKLLKLADAALAATNAWARWQGRPGGNSAVEDNTRIISESRGDVVTSTGAFGSIKKVGDRGTSRTKTSTDAFGMSYSKIRRMRLPKGGRGGGRSYGSDRVNAFGEGSPFGGTDWSQFLPTAASSDWIKAASASEVMKENSATVDVLMKRIATEYSETQARNAEAAAKGMGDQAEAAQRIIDRLYPDRARLREYHEDLQKLRSGMDAGAISAAQLADAEKLLRAELEADVPALAKVNEAIARYVNTSKDAAIKSEAANDVIAESFERTADRALYALDRLAASVRDGGFLDILSSVLDLGLQLLPLVSGSGSGASSVKTGNVGGIKGAGKTPGFAMGGSMILGGRSGIDRNLLSLNGAPLARVSAGEHMTIAPANDRAGNARMNGELVVRLEKDGSMSAYFEGIAGRVVERSAPGIAAAGAGMAIGRLQKQSAKSLG